MSDRSEGARSVGETRRHSAFWPAGILEPYVEDQNVEFKRRNQEMAPAVDCLMKYSGYPFSASFPRLKEAKTPPTQRMAKMKKQAWRLATRAGWFSGVILTRPK